VVAVHIGSGQYVLLSAKTVSRPIDEKDIDAYGPWRETDNSITRRMELSRLMASAPVGVFELGGKGSGNFGHAGRPGQLGGSQASAGDGYKDPDYVKADDAANTATRYASQSGALANAHKSSILHQAAKEAYGHASAAHVKAAELGEPLGVKDSTSQHRGMAASHMRSAEFHSKAAAKYSSGQTSVNLGGPGSGNFGHSGRPGEIGGSAGGTAETVGHRYDIGTIGDAGISPSSRDGSSGRPAPAAGDSPLTAAAKAHGYDSPQAVSIAMKERDAREKSSRKALYLTPAQATTASADRLRMAMVSAATAHDNKMAEKPGHNPYALPQYLAAVDNIHKSLAGKNTSDPAVVRRAVLAHTQDRLATAILKSVGQTAITREEARGY
jgi:hypothetical protein